jgi:hypothetical protein
MAESPLASFISDRMPPSSLTFGIPTSRQINRRLIVILRDYATWHNHVKR